MFARIFEYLVLGVLTCGGSAASATDVVAAPASQTPVIALAPVLAPAKITIQNRGGVTALFALPGLLAQRDLEKARESEFRKLLEENSLNLEKELASALRAALIETGQQVVELDEIKYVVGEPRTLEYKMLKSSGDLVLTADIFDVGLYSGQFSRKYLPRLNVTFDLVNRHTEDYVYSQSIYYGADARKSAEDQIPSDPQYAFDSYEQAVERQREIVQALRDGIRQIALLVAAQLRSAKK